MAERVQSQSKNLITFINGTVVLPTKLIKNGIVVCRGGRIQKVGSRRTLPVPSRSSVIDAGGGYITPGYVDIHVHGGAGADYMDGTRDAVITANRAHARHGTTTIFPTTTTGSPRQISAMLRACLKVKQEGSVTHGARLAGVHFYGPYFAEDKVGCHSVQGRRDPQRREYLKHFETGLIRVATCAAELPGAEEFYREAAARGCLVTCGHSNASWGEMMRGFQVGLRHVDHFWCAMSSVPSLRQRLGTPMQASMEQFVIARREMSTEVIADGCHLSPELMDYAYTMLGPQRLCLVTDCNRALDMPPGRYRFGPQSDGSWFESDGRVGFQPGAGLASSVVGMDVMVANMAQQTRAGLAASIRMGSLTPAERVGLAQETGSLEMGKRADVLVLDHDLNVERIFIGGEEFQR